MKKHQIKLLWVHKGNIHNILDTNQISGEKAKYGNIGDLNADYFNANETDCEPTKAAAKREVVFSAHMAVIRQNLKINYDYQIFRQVIFGGWGE